MSDTKISEMAALAGADVADGDLLPIVDISAAAGAKNKTLTPVEARIALVTAAAIEAALGYEPATAAQGALAETASQPPTGTGYVHVTSGVQDAAAGNPLVVAATGANATLSSSATVTGSGDATVGLVAQTGTGAATAQLGAAVITLGNASFAVGSTSVTAGNATAALSASAATGDASAPVSATVSTLGAASANTAATSTTAGNATANTTATAAIGEANANRTATSGTGNAYSNTASLVTGAGIAEACADAEVGTPDGSSEALARIRATAGAHETSVSVVANSTGSSLEVAIEGDVGAAGQFLGSTGGTEKAIWQTPLVRHAAGVPSGAPGVAELPIAFDSTAVSGGFYFWDGAAWVKCSTIP